MGKRERAPEATRRALLKGLAASGWLALEGGATVAWLLDSTARVAAAGPGDGDLFGPLVHGPTPWAVILCQFSDVPKPSIPDSAFKDLFTVGRHGVADYFGDISYGAVDLSASEVFGWWPMGYSYAKDGGLTREHFLEEAKRLFREKVKDKDLSSFYGVVAIVNGDPDDSNVGGRDFVLGLEPDWGQKGWGWCAKCEGMVFSGSGTGVCPADKGPHSLSSGTPYRLPVEMPGFPGQDDWRLCRACKGLFYAGFDKGVCPAGKEHDATGSGNYRIGSEPATTPSQEGWRWCEKCQLLSFADATRPRGPCPAGGTHVGPKSSKYVVPYPRYYVEHLALAFCAHEMGHGYGLHEHAHCA